MSYPTRCVLVAVSLAGCGRVAFEPISTPDASSVDAASGCAMGALLSVPLDATIEGTLGDGGSMSGTCGGDAAEDVYAIDVEVAGSGLFFAVDGMPVYDTAPIAAYIRTDCDAPSSELACDTMSGIGQNPALRLSDLPAGRYFGFVDGLVVTPYSGTFQVLLPDGAACDPAEVRDRCGADLACVDGRCTPTACADVIDLQGPSPVTFTATTTGRANDHAGSCGIISDGGLRSPEAIYSLRIAGAVSDVVVDTTGTMAFDTLVYVRDGCHGAEVVCNDGYSSPGGEVTHTGPLAPGTYYIFIDGFGGKQGTAGTTVTVVP